MEWLSMGSVYATGWVFADTAQALAGNVDHALAFASYSKRRTSHVRHHRCTLIRGASQPQKEPHAQLCPYELKPADSRPWLYRAAVKALLDGFGRRLRCPGPGIDEYGRQLPTETSAPATEPVHPAT